MKEVTMMKIGSGTRSITFELTYCYDNPWVEIRQMFGADAEMIQIKLEDWENVVKFIGKQVIEHTSPP
jgi:hypothetical protein